MQVRQAPMLFVTFLQLLHRFPDANPFDVRAQEYELEYLHSSEHAQAALAEQYAGLPL